MVEGKGRQAKCVCDPLPLFPWVGRWKGQMGHRRVQHPAQEEVKCKMLVSILLV